MVKVKAVIAVWTPLTVVPEIGSDAADGHVHRGGGKAAQELRQHERRQHPPSGRSRRAHRTSRHIRHSRLLIVTTSMRRLKLRLGV